MFYFARGQSPPRHDEAFGQRILLPRVHRQTPLWGKTDGTAMVAARPQHHWPTSLGLVPFAPLAPFVPFARRLLPPGVTPARRP